MTHHLQGVVDEAFIRIDEFEHLQKPEQIAASVARVAARFGFTAFILTGLPATAQRLGESVLLDAWPRAWLTRYLEAGHFSHDPCARYCRMVNEPFAWGEIPRVLVEEPRSRQVVDEAGDYGFRDGLCIPLHTIHGFRGISLAGERIELPPGARRMLTLLSVFACEAVERAAPPPQTRKPQARLTPREREVLRWVALGKTVDEVAEILGLSGHTVTEHLRKSRAKLAATNTVHAVVLALRTRQLLL